MAEALFLPIRIVSVSVRQTQATSPIAITINSLASKSEAEHQRKGDIKRRKAHHLAEYIHLPALFSVEAYKHWLCYLRTILLHKRVSIWCSIDKPDLVPVSREE